MGPGPTPEPRLQVESPGNEVGKQEVLSTGVGRLLKTDDGKVF